MILTISIIAPLLFGILLLMMPAEKRPEKPTVSLMLMALLGSIISLGAGLYLAFSFESADPGFQLVETWYSSTENGISYSFGLDGISLGLYVLSVVLFPLGVYYSYVSFQTNAAQGKKVHREKLFWFSLMLLETAVLGVFAAKDLIVFYVFWELILIPMVLLIGIWGGTEKKYASIKFFIYTFAGSVFLIIGIVGLIYFNSRGPGSFDIERLLAAPITSIPMSLNKYLFWAFILSFLVKIPAFPVHTWLPHAHTQAPTVGSVVLAGVLLKMGTYGIFRFSLPMFPLVSAYYSNMFMVIGVIGIIYGAWLAWAQTDMKKLVAYSSVSHMGYIVLGMFSGNLTGLSGAYMQMINHGISTGLLFLLVGMIYDRTHTREIEKYGGLAKMSPAFAVIFMIATLSSVGLPGTNGFIGEFMILLGTFAVSPVIAVFALLGVIFGAVYMLHLYKQVFFGEPSEFIRGVKEKLSLKITPKEILITAPFVIMIFWLGFQPNMVLKSSESSLQSLLSARNKKIAAFHQRSRANYHKKRIQMQKRYTTPLHPFLQKKQKPGGQ